jgi:hypothetical protein
MPEENKTGKEVTGDADQTTGPRAMKTLLLAVSRTLPLMPRGRMKSIRLL